GSPKSCSSTPTITPWHFWKTLPRLRGTQARSPIMRAMPWIRTVEPEDARGRLAEAYQWQARKLGRPTEFTQLGSLDAEVVLARLNLYRASESVPSRLTPTQRLLISYLTSILNSTP